MIEHSLASTRWFRALVLLTLLIAFVTAACGTPSGEKLVEDKCTGCHTWMVIGVSSKTAHEWRNTVYRMENLGADVDENEVDAIVDYLATNFGPESPVP